MSSAIALQPNQYQFLKAGLGEGGIGRLGSKLTMYCVAEGMVMTTNGYSLHMIRIDNKVKSGYYIWSQEAKALYMLDQEELPTSGNLLKSVLELREKYRVKYADQKLLPILTFEMGGHSEGLSMKYTVRRNSSPALAFRKGRFRGREYNICLGMNYAPLLWGKDDTAETELVDRERILYLDANLLHAVVKGIGNLPMMWLTPKEPAIFGGFNDNQQAIVMPIYSPNW